MIQLIFQFNGSEWLLLYYLYVFVDNVYIFREQLYENIVHIVDK